MVEASISRGTLIDEILPRLSHWLRIRKLRAPLRLMPTALRKGNILAAMSGMQVKVFSMMRARTLSWCLDTRSMATAPPNDRPKTAMFLTFVDFAISGSSRWHKMA